MISINKSPLDIRKELAERFKKERLLKNLSREGLSEKSGISAATIRKFEDTGEISLKSFISLSFSLDKMDEIENLMKSSEPTTVNELNNRKRLRGRQ